MYKSKLIQLYQTFSSTQLEQARKWVNSPIHNRDKDVSKLFDYLLSNQSMTSGTIDRKKVFACIYPKREYDDLHLQDLMSLVVNSLEEFVCFSIQNENHLNPPIALIQYSQSNELSKLTEQPTKKEKKNQDKKKVQSKEYYYQKYELDREVLREEEHSNKAKTALQRVFDNHSTAFIIETLRLAALAILDQGENNTTYIMPLLGAILEDIELGKYKDIRAIQLYYCRYMLLATPENENHWNKFKRLLFSSSKHLSLSEIKDFYFLGIDYCNKQISLGEKLYLKEAFELYQYSLEQKVILEDGVLSPFMYRNILATALASQNHLWASEFVTKYTIYLEEKYQASYNRYARVNLLFSKGVYKSTLILLQQAVFEELELELDSQAIQLKIHYEQKDKDSLYTLIASFYGFLKNEALSVDQRNNYKNMIKFTQKLIQLSTDNPNAKQDILEQIKETNPLTERIWLLEKLDTAF
jgi:hypothetical protein